MNVKIEEKVLKKIINSYKNFLTDDTDVGGFVQSIYTKIDQYRIKLVSSVDEFGPNVNESSTFYESYCHAFYRILGLPITSNQNTFYSPGYYSPDFPDYENLRKNIGKNQNRELVNLESIRESVCFKNVSVFLSKTEDSHNYKINMLRYPRSVVVLKESNDPFKIDKQIENIKDRDDKHKIVQHIIRPFRCSPNIGAVEKILVPTKNLAAPFFYSNNENEKYNSTYLETVCKTRFLTIAKIQQNEFVKPLIDLLKTIEVNGQNVFSSVLEQQSIIEIYTLNVLVNKFIQMSLDYAKKNKEYKSLSNKYSELDKEIVSLSDNIEKLELRKLQYESIQTFLPNDIINVNGMSIQLSNMDKGVLTGELIKILNSPVAKINSLLAEQINKKNAHMSEINNLSNSLFNITGEVFGISALEILALMISFWAIPQSSLLSLLDDPAFLRLYSQNSLLRNEVVLERNASSDRKPQKDINTVIGEIDTIVYNLLYLADAIIQYSYRDSET